MLGHGIGGTVAWAGSCPRGLARVTHGACSLPSPIPSPRRVVRGQRGRGQLYIIWHHNQLIISQNELALGCGIYPEIHGCILRDDICITPRLTKMFSQGQLSSTFNASGVLIIATTTLIPTRKLFTTLNDFQVIFCICTSSSLYTLAIMMNKILLLQKLLYETSTSCNLNLYIYKLS